jgi:hypothetical protein
MIMTQARDNFLYLSLPFDSAAVLLDAFGMEHAENYGRVANGRH